MTYNLVTGFGHNASPTESNQLGQSLPLPNHNGVKSLTTGQLTETAGHRGSHTMADTCLPQCSARQQQTERQGEKNKTLSVAVACTSLFDAAL